MLLESDVSKNYTFCYSTCFIHDHQMQNRRIQEEEKISARKCSSDVSDEMEFARKLCISAKMLTTKIYYYPEPDSRLPADISYFSRIYFLFPNKMEWEWVNDWLEISTFCLWLDWDSPQKT